jgi:hypothetical protein
MQLRSSGLASFTIGLILVGAAPAQAGAPLVDCSDKRFKSGNKADSLMGWSNRSFKEAQKAKAKGKSAPKAVCEKLISYRGDAHCQVPENQEYRRAVTEALAVCSAAEDKPAESPKTEIQPSNVPVPPKKPLVDCAKKRFHSGVSTNGLMGFSDRVFKMVKAAEARGDFPKDRCEELISQRGDAHCQKLDDPKIRGALEAALDLCHRLEHPAPVAGKRLVNCKENRFQLKHSVPTLLGWSKIEMRDLSQWNARDAEAKCQEAYGHAGSAHCRAPNNKDAQQAVRSVAESCAQDQERRAANAKAGRAAEIKRLATQKANRRIVKLPKGKGGAVAKQMKAALLQGRVAKSPREILKTRVTTGWQTGRFVDTKVRYRKISGWVLWHDEDKDGVCRFSSYNFIQTKSGKSWSKLAFKSFCAGCAEGWTKCP